MKKKVFSIPAFLFGAIYFAYRKLLLHAVFVSLFLTIVDVIASKVLNVGLMIIAELCARISIGLFFPLWYRSFYKNATRKIIERNSSQSEEQCIKLLQKKGGTSILFIILFIIINCIMSISLNKLLNVEDKNVNSNLSNTVSSTSTNNTDDLIFLENASINGYASTGNEYSIYIDGEEFECTAENPDVLALVKDYDELSANIYYSENNDSKTIVKYELYNNLTNEKIENITDETALRELLGYYSEGNYEENLTLIKKDNSTGIGYDDDVKYSYYDLVFETESGNSLEFKYKIYENTENKFDMLNEKQTYKVNFTVKKDFFDYEYAITDIEEL